MPEFQFVGPSYTAADPRQDIQESINYYPEIAATAYSKVPSQMGGDAPDAKAPMALLSAPGCISAVTSAYTGEVRGCWVFSFETQCLWVIGSSVVLMTVTSPASGSALATFSLATVGSLVTSSGQVHMRDNGVGGVVVISDGVNGYVYNVAAQTVTQITDPAWLGSDRISMIDGIFIFNQPGTQKFYTSPIYWDGVSAIDPTYYALKDDFSDPLVAHIENQRELWLVGSQTSEVWYNAGGSYFQFSRLEGAMIQIGCGAKNSLCKTGQGLIWLGRSERGENVVVMTQGYQYQQVSSPAVAYAISQYDVTSDAIGYAYTEEGHEFYVLTFPTANVTWVYDLTTQMWHKRARFDTTTGTFGRHRSNCYANFSGQRLIGDYANGQIYRLTRQVYVDGPDPLISLRRTPHYWDHGERNRITQSRLQIEFVPGQGLPNGQGSDPVASLRWSNDGGMSWSNVYQLHLGKIGEYNRRAMKRRLGAARDRVYEVRVSDPVNRDILSATIRGESLAA